MRKILSSLVVISVLALFSAPAFASVYDDQVTSQKIKEADGTSGQNTNSGSGVKTGHIQDGAVTDAKIAGPISAGKISSAGLDADTIDGKHALDLAPVVHTHGLPDVLGLDAILGTKADANHNHDAAYSPIAHNHDGAYSPVGHNHDGIYQQKYAQVLAVAKSGGDFTDPVAALNSITDASADKPYLIKIMPGIYDIGSATLLMKDHVDVEGSGENVTTIKGTKAIIANYVANLEIRLVTIESTLEGVAEVVTNWSMTMKLSHVTIKGSSSINCYGLVNFNGGKVLLNDSTVIVSATNQALGVYGEHGGSEIFVNNSTIQAAGAGWSFGAAVDWGGALIMNNSKVISEGYGLHGWMNAPITVRNSEISSAGTPNGCSVYSNSPVKIANTLLDGPLCASATCISVYDANFAPIACP